MSGKQFADLRFDEHGLVPAVIQDAESGDVLMMAFMNAEALAATRATGRTHFWSRSRGKLWRKGESSGHEQVVDEIFVNCELNSLLITVRQIGATCHDGYPTCYYRRVEADGSLTIVRDRWFDPADVYGDGKGIAALTRRWYGAYEHLRDHDLTAESGTSRRLRAGGQEAVPRIADELQELAGVLDGSHRHTNLEEDIALEGSQCLYWLVICAAGAGVTWDALRPDRALDNAASGVTPDLAARLLRAEAMTWTVAAGSVAAERIHATIALVAQAAASAGMTPRALVERDVVDLESRSYLSYYFSTVA